MYERSVIIRDRTISIIPRPILPSRAIFLLLPGQFLLSLKQFYCPSSISTIHGIIFYHAWANFYCLQVNFYHPKPVFNHSQTYFSSSRPDFTIPGQFLLPRIIPGPIFTKTWSNFYCLWDNLDCAWANISIPRTSGCH